MANRARGELDFTLDRPRVWCLTWKEISEVENALLQLRGKKITWREFCQDFQNWGIEDFSIVLWAGLHHEDKKLTLEEVMNLATGVTFQSFAYEFAELLQDAIPERIKKKLEQEAKKMLADQLEKTAQPKT